MTQQVAALFEEARGIASEKIKMILMHSIKSLQQTFPARAGEWALAIITFNLGIVFFHNDGLFEIYPEQWRGLTVWASQHTWASVCMILGLARLIILFINGAYWRSPHFRAGFAFITCFLWWSLATGLFHNLSIGAAILPVLLGFDAFNVLRVGREIGIAEYLHRIRKAQRNGSTKS